MTFDCPEQLAGFSQIEFNLISETSGWPVVLTDANAGTVAFTPEEHDVDGSIVPESINVNDQPTDSEAGQLWPIDITFTYLYRGEPMEQLLEQYANRPGVVRACLNDGTRKLFGSDQQPVYMTWRNLYGDKIEDRSGVQIRIRGEQNHRPVFYTPEA